jgi:hypothetical protein
VTGCPETVADEMQHFQEATGIDGFNLAYTVLPECFEDFVELVVPELQKRKVFKTQYRQGTLRQKLFSAGDRLPASHPADGYRNLTG